MFGCFFALIVEGMPPEDAHPYLVITYSAFISISFGLLFLCMWFTMKYLTRMADFNLYNKKQIYVCGNSHSSFEGFYSCHCSKPAKLANNSFYFGTLNLIGAATILCYTRFVIVFNNIPASYIYVGVTILTLLILLSLHFIFPTSTRRIKLTREPEIEMISSTDDLSEISKSFNN